MDRDRFVQEVQSFWDGFCQRERLDDTVRHDGGRIIADDPEYWANVSMWKVVDAIEEGRSIHYDYRLQCWVRAGRIERCGHPSTVRACTGCHHAGRIADEVRFEQALPAWTAEEAN